MHPRTPRATLKSVSITWIIESVEDRSPLGKAPCLRSLSDSTPNNVGFGDFIENFSTFDTAKKSIYRYLQ